MEEPKRERQLGCSSRFGGKGPHPDLVSRQKEGGDSIHDTDSLHQLSVAHSLYPRSELSVPEEEDLPESGGATQLRFSTSPIQKCCLLVQLNFQHITKTNKQILLDPIRVSLHNISRTGVQVRPLWI